MSVPDVELAGCRASHQRLDEAIAGLTDEQARQPSRLPGWSVGHVLTHLARNADSVVRRLEAAARGEVVDQYVGGREGRAADIEAGAARPAVELLADVRTSSARCDEACAGVPAEVWERPTRGLGGDVSPAAFLAFSRWREVEVHHVDLGLGYEPSSWPAELVERWLPHELGRLPGRTEPAALLAWALGRAEAPPLGDW
ncbi:MAG: maleylpyruvate isomerase family mycothiol-dependent enzyme [Acidimicrobiales bacterium]